MDTLYLYMYAYIYNFALFTQKLSTSLCWLITENLIKVQFVIMMRQIVSKLYQ